MRARPGLTRARRPDRRRGGEILDQFGSLIVEADELRPLTRVSVAGELPNRAAVPCPESMVRSLSVVVAQVEKLTRPPGS